jgi:hypothetical protein
MLNIVGLLLVAGYWTVELLVAGRLIALRSICESFRNCVKTSTVSSSSKLLALAVACAALLLLPDCEVDDCWLLE